MIGRKILGLTFSAIVIWSGRQLCAQSPADLPIRVVPINAAEAVFEPFWDPQFSGIDRWKWGGAEQCGLERKGKGSFYTTASFEWARPSDKAPVLDLSRNFSLDITGYDQLLVSMFSAPGTSVSIEVHTDKGLCRGRFDRVSSQKQEYVVELPDAQVIKSISIQVFSNQTAPGGCGISWVGLRNKSARAFVDAQWKKLAAQPLDVYLQPGTFKPEFKPRRGILLSSLEIDRIRNSFSEYQRAHPNSGFSASIYTAYAPPEELIGEYIGNANVGAYGRTDIQNKKWPEVDRIAATALVLKDPELLRQAARYAIAMAMTQYWDAGFPCYFPGSAYEQRPFAHSAIAWQLAITLDLADEMFSDAGRELIRRRLAEHALGNINFVVWRWEYITRNNQLAAFSRGRLAAYALLSRDWAPTRPYMDLACQELTDSLNKALLQDGSNVEGSGYFNYMMMSALDALWVYSRAKNVPLADVLPPIIKKTDAYIEVFRTTDESSGGLIPVGDSQDRGGGLPHRVAAMMAAAMPDSAWADIYDHMRPSVVKKMDDDLILWNCDRPPETAHRTYQSKPLVILPESGYLASTRKIGGELVKILIYGNRANAGHAHEDKGSFVLEFAGDTFACDPGGWNYSDPQSGLARQAQRHNMLVPSIASGIRPAPLNPIPANVKPTAEGDEIRFHAEINATPGWEKYYEHWKRTWQSTSPDQLEITDDYALKNTSGAEFTWMTGLHATQSGNTVIIHGKRGSVTLIPPDSARIEIEELPLRENGKINRIRFVYTEKSASKTVRVLLSGIIGT